MILLAIIIVGIFDWFMQDFNVAGWIYVVATIFAVIEVSIYTKSNPLDILGDIF